MNSLQWGPIIYSSTTGNSVHLCSHISNIIAGKHLETKKKIIHNMSFFFYCNTPCMKQKPKEKSCSLLIEVLMYSVAVIGRTAAHQAVARRRSQGRAPSSAEAFCSGPTVEPTDGPCSHV